MAAGEAHPPNLGGEPDHVGVCVEQASLQTTVPLRRSGTAVEGGLIVQTVGARKKGGWLVGHPPGCLGGCAVRQRGGLS